MLLQRPHPAPKDIVKPVPSLVLGLGGRDLIVVGHDTRDLAAKGPLLGAALLGDAAIVPFH